MTAAEIKALRLRLGLSQQAMAVRLGVSVQSIHRWEHGTKPHPFLEKLLQKEAQK